MIALVSPPPSAALAFVVASIVDREGRRARLAAPARGLPDPGRARPGDAGADQRARPRAAVEGLTGVAGRLHAAGYGEKDRAEARARGQPARTSTSTRSWCSSCSASCRCILWLPLVSRARSSRRILALVVIARAVGRARSCTPTCSSQPQDRGPPEGDLAQAARHPRPARDLGGSRPRLRAGARPHHAPRCPARCRTSSAACCTRSASVRRGPTRCARWPSAPRCPSSRTFILAMLQADTFGVSISRLLRSQADEMRIRRRLRGAGAGAEGAGEDAVPAGVLHLPVDLRGHPRPRDDPASRARSER